MRSQIDRLAEDLRKKNLEFFETMELFHLLPKDLPEKPLIHIHHKYSKLVVNGLGFTESYKSKNDPVAILESLERGGWKLIPSTLCRYGNWRPSVWWGDDMPKHDGRYDLLDSWEIAPIWINLGMAKFPRRRIEMHLAHGAVIIKVAIEIEQHKCVDIYGDKFQPYYPDTMRHHRSHSEEFYFRAETYKQNEKASEFVQRMIWREQD